MARKFSPKEYSRTTKSIRFTVLAGLRCIFESIRLNFVNSQNNRVLCEKYSIGARTETDQALRVIAISIFGFLTFVLLTFLLKKEQILPPRINQF